MSDDINELTAQERHEFSIALVRQRLQSKEDLRLWCLYYLDVDLADCIVSRYANSTPLDMVWDLYLFCANDTNEEPLSTFYIAGRGSQKTLSCAVLQVLLPLHFARGIVHLGGTEDQAHRAYAYFKRFITRPYIKDYLYGDPKISKTIFRLVDQKQDESGTVTSVINDVEIEILPLTESSVQGPHQPVVSIDELASLAPNKLAAYPSIAGIPVYTQDGKPWVKFGISSRKGRYTIIESEYEERHKTGAIFKFWTVLENTKQCPDSISGTEPLTMYVNPFENKALLQADYEKLDELKRGGFEKVEARKGCYTCPLAAICGGDLKKQTSTCRTLKPTKATIKDFKSSPLDWFLSQRMSLQPSAEDLVYPKFKRIEFEKTPREIYTIFTGQDPGVDISVAELVREMIKANVKRYAGIDHGYTHPFAIVVVFEDSQGTCYIMEAFEMSGLEPPEVVDLVNKMKAKYDFSIVYPDTASPAINKMISKFVKVGDDFTKVPADGIALIRHKLTPNVGVAKLYGVKGNVDPLINNLEKYHFAYDSSGKLTDKPVKDFDDSHDGLSYAAQNRWNKGRPFIAPDVNTTPPDPYNPIKEDPAAYNKKVQSQYDNWLTQTIHNETKEQGATTGVKTSKNRGAYWDID